MWECKSCHKMIEDEFDGCAICGTPRHVPPDPKGQAVEEPATPRTVPPIARYEFNVEMKELMGDLAKKMRLVGKVLSVLGWFSAVASFLCLILVQNPKWLSTLVHGIIAVVLGHGIGGAAASLRYIVESPGNDINNLMEALRSLKTVFTVLYWLFIISVVIVFLTALVIVS